MAKTYQDLKQELDTIIAQLQDEQTELDQAVVLHKKGLKILEELEAYVTQASEAAAK